MPLRESNNVLFGIVDLVIHTVIMCQIFTNMWMAFPNSPDPTLFPNVRFVSEPSFTKLTMDRPKILCRTSAGRTSKSI